MKLSLCTESKLALLFGVVFGLLAVALVPPAVTYDGPSHYFRALQVSEGTIRSTIYTDRAVGGSLPSSHANFVHTLWDSYWNKKDFGTVPSWSNLGRESAAIKGSSVVEFTNTAVYSPVNYLFQASGMRLAALFTASPLAASQLGCLFDLAGFVLVVVAAIEIIPRCRKTVLLVSMSPLLLLQAASLSTDAINFSLPLLVLACAWRLRDGPCARPGQLLAVVLALGWATVLLKPTSVTALLCLWLIPSAIFGSRASKVTALGLHLLLAVALWYWWNKPNLGIDIARWFEPGRPHASELKQWFLANPLRFASPFLNCLTSGLVPQLPLMFGGVGGWISVPVMHLLAGLSIVFYVGVVVSESGSYRVDAPWASGMLLQALATLLLVALTLWLAFGTIGMDSVPYLVGRYLLPVVLCAGIALGELFHSGLPKVRYALFWTALAANGAGLTAILISIGSRTA